MTATNKGKGRVSITLPISIKRRVSELAREDGVSESAWMAAAVVERIGSLSAAALFSEARRAGQCEARSLDSAPRWDAAAPAR